VQREAEIDGFPVVGHVDHDVGHRGQLRIEPRRTVEHVREDGVDLIGDGGEYPDGPSIATSERRDR